MMESSFSCSHRTEPVRGLAPGECRRLARGRSPGCCNTLSSRHSCRYVKDFPRPSKRLSQSVRQRPTSLRGGQQPTTTEAQGAGLKADENENGVPARKIVFAVDGTTDAEEGLRWVVKEIARKGTVVFDFINGAVRH